MSDMTRLLDAAAAGDRQAAADLLPLVYDELRKLAHHYLQCERPGATLQSTVLVHEAYLRLVKQEPMDGETCVSAAILDPDGNVVGLHTRKDGTWG